jgi:hypothetical protein
VVVGPDEEAELCGADDQRAGHGRTPDAGEREDRDNDPQEPERRRREHDDPAGAV